MTAKKKNGSPRKLSQEEYSNCFNNAKAGDKASMLKLTSDTIKHYRHDFDRMQKTYVFVEQCAHQNAPRVLRDLSLLALRLGWYKSAYHLIDTLLQSGELRSAFMASIYLRKCDDEELNEKGFSYLRIAANAGHVGARQELFSNKMRPIGWLGRILVAFYGFFFLLPHIAWLAHRDKDDPRLDFLPE